MRIERAVTAESLVAASHLFDHPASHEGALAFLEAPRHHLLLALDGDDDRAVGFVSGVEMTHPDKGTEMFLYELSVDEASRGQGVGAALVEALGALARERGCYGMWVHDRPRQRGGPADVRRRRREGRRLVPHARLDLRGRCSDRVIRGPNPDRPIESVPCAASVGRVRPSGG